MTCEVISIIFSVIAGAITGIPIGAVIGGVLVNGYATSTNQDFQSGYIFPVGSITVLTGILVGGVIGLGLGCCFWINLLKKN